MGLDYKTNGLKYINVLGENLFIIEKCGKRYLGSKNYHALCVDTGYIGYVIFRNFADKKVYQQFNYMTKNQ